VVSRVVLSVPHSGTRSLRLALDCLSFHTYVSVDRLEQDLKDAVVVSPLRDPYRIWDSWVKRLGTPDEVPQKHFERSWAKLAMLDHIYDIVYIPLDKSARETQWAFLESQLGEKIEIDWGHREGHLEEPGPTKELPRNLWWVYQLPMIKRFYGA